MTQWWKRNAGWLAVVYGMAGVVLSVAVVVQAAMLHSRGWRVNWGTLPDWLVAGRTSLAAVGVIAAFGTMRITARDWESAEKERRSLQEERQEANKERRELAAIREAEYQAAEAERREQAAIREAERQDQFIRQARLIIVEPVHRHLPDGRPYPRQHFVIHNRSTEPIFDLRIDQQVGLAIVKQLLPGRDPLDSSATSFSSLYRFGPQDISALPPGETTGELYPETNQEPNMSKYLRFTFTDARGARWQRRGNDQPVQIFGEESEGAERGTGD